MPHLTFADLVSRRVPLAASEAAALTLAVAHVMDLQRAAGQPVRLPDDEWILLSSSGEVSLVEVHRAAEVDETAALSALLRRLLQLDHRENGHSTAIPGGLLIVLARNLGYIHLPATSPQTFRAALNRFATPDPAVLASVFWRAASGRPDSVVSRKPVPRRAPIERRQRGLSRTDLRRALRELERENFELRRVPSPRRRRPRLSPFARLSGTRIPPQVFTSALSLVFIGLVAAGAVAVTRVGPPVTAATGADIVLQAPPDWSAPAHATPIITDTPRIVRANHLIGAAGSNSGAVRRTSRSPALPRANDPASVTKQEDEVTTSTRPRRPRTRPAAGMPGGTRGIPFALP